MSLGKRSLRPGKRGSCCEVRRVRGQGYLFDDAKIESSERVIALAPVAAAALVRHREAQPQECLWAKRWVGIELVFPSRVGTPLTSQNFLRRDFARLLARAGIGHLTFHEAARHRAAMLLALAGLRPEVIAALLGHAKVAMRHQEAAMQTLFAGLGGDLAAAPPAERRYA